MNILMVRSPSFLLNKGYIGYGWPKVDFSQHQDVNALMEAFKQQYSNGIGRHANNIKRFFNLKDGDIVVVPSQKAISIGIVKGQKIFSPEWAKNDACNLISVEFLMSENQVLKIPRSHLLQQLESRLKVRTAIADLRKFEAVIIELIDSIKKSGNVYQQSSYFSGKIEQAEEEFKADLCQSIAIGTTRLSAGGYGLEKLIKELLEIDGYKADIKAKNQSSDIADIDIEASRVDRFSETYLLIQAKHHKGQTNRHGLNQLIAYSSEDGNYQKWLITTAEVSDENKEFAKQNNIEIMEGKELVDWIYDNLARLSEKSKQMLGIIEIPSLLKL